MTQAIFSMVFFYNVEDQHGTAKLAVMPQWWYFLAITISLTILVFLTWIIWQRWKAQALNDARSARDTQIKPALPQVARPPSYNNFPHELMGFSNAQRIDSTGSTSYNSPYFDPRGYSGDNDLMYQF